jgi:NADH dehydrogenase FAD-containing subunit
MTLLDSTHYKTDKGTAIEADFVVYAGGTKPNSEFMKDNFSAVLNPQGQIMVCWMRPSKILQVDEYFRVTGLDNVYALGDVTDIKEERRLAL